MTLQSGTVNQIPWNSQKCLTLYFSNAGIFFQCQSKAILQSGSKYDRSEVQLKFFSHYDIQIIFWIRYLGMHYAVGCPKYSKHLIFDLIWTFRILRIQDLNIFELWISVFASFWTANISHILNIFDTQARTDFWVELGWIGYAD